MGRYYALHDGEQADVAAAIEEQYRPRFAGDALPATATGDRARARRQARDAGRAVRHRRVADRRQGSVRAAPARARRRAHPDREEPAARPRPARRRRRSTSCRRRTATAATSRARSSSSCCERLRGYCRDHGYTANEVEAVLAQTPTRSADVPLRLAGGARVRRRCPKRRASRRPTSACATSSRSPTTRTATRCRAAAARRPTPSSRCSKRSASSGRAPRSAYDARRLHGGAARAGVAEGAGRPLLRRGDGQCRRPGDPRRTASALLSDAARADEPRRRHLARRTA